MIIICERVNGKSAVHGSCSCAVVILCHFLICRIWAVQFNLFHDQLVLTASSDSQVVLSRMASVASEPLQPVEEEEEEEEEEGEEEGGGDAH